LAVSSRRASHVIFPTKDVRKRIREVRACAKAYSFALELFDKRVRLPAAPNVHYGAGELYMGLLQLSMDGGYAQSTMDDRRRLVQPAMTVRAAINGIIRIVDERGDRLCDEDSEHLPIRD
jgi:hypothetical protein